MMCFEVSFKNSCPAGGGGGSERISCQLIRETGDGRSSGWKFEAVSGESFFGGEKSISFNWLQRDGRFLLLSGERYKVHLTMKYDRDNPFPQTKQWPDPEDTL